MDRRAQRLLTGWLDELPAPNTRAAYRRDLTAFLRWCDSTSRPSLSLTPADIDRYRDACLAAGAGAATVARRLSAIASFFRFAVAAGEVDAQPVAGVDRPTPPDPAASPVLDAAELAAVVGAAGDLGAKVATLVALVALDGMKLGEVLGIDVDDVNLSGAGASVMLRRRGRRQELVLRPETATALAAYIADRRSGPLFLGDSAVAHEPARLTRFGADFIIKRAGSVAEIDKPVSASVLRRSYIRCAHEAGQPLDEIAEHVGHRAVRDTARFVTGRYQ